MKSKCLYPNCNYVAISRGLCRNCYNTALHLVKAKKTSWAELEQKGKAIKNPGKTGLTNWLLSLGEATTESKTKPIL